jgi:hypothetical protein
MNEKEETVEDAATDVDCDTSTGESLSEAQGTENFIETYHAISEWIRFADAKAAVILTVGAALAGFLIPTIQLVINDIETSHLIPNWKIVCISLFCIYLLFLLASGIFAFLCINPLRQKGKHPSLDHCTHFHPAAIANAFTSGEVQRFVGDCRKIGTAGLQREVQAAILLDSHISAAKYNKVSKSLFHFAISVAAGFIYFVAAQL